MRPSPLFKNVETSNVYEEERADSASFKGIALKTTILLLLTTLSAVLVAIFLPSILSYEERIAEFYVVLIIAMVVGFISAIVGRISDRAAKYASVIYALCEGITLGFITTLVEYYAPGVGFICVFATLAIFGVMLLLYSIKVIRLGSMFRKIFLGVIIGMLVLSIITLIGMFTIKDASLMLGLCIGLEVMFLLYGVITLAFNFEEAKNVVKAGCSKSSEWSVALGLEISLVYIYVELLRLALLVLESRN